MVKHENPTHRLHQAEHHDFAFPAIGKSCNQSFDRILRTCHSRAGVFYTAIDFKNIITKSMIRMNTNMRHVNIGFVSWLKKICNMII